MASGQAQEQRVNLENSIKLQRNMMKMVFGELAYQRQLFPEDCFELKEMGGNHIHTLSAESDNVYHEQVSRMISWYSDDSILDALRNGYLEKVMFVLAHDQACEHPIEVWDLSYTYESDDTVSSRFTRRSGGGGAPASESIEVARSRPKDKVTKDYIRDVVKVVLRRLSLLLQGLDDVPQERWCGMRLLYRDDVTPSDYEPSGFSPAPATVAGAGSFFFERPATFFMVGKVSTGHHALSLGVALPEMPGIEPTAHDEACTTRDGSGYRFDLVQAADGPPDDEDELRGGVGLRGGRRGNGEDLERLTQEASEGLEDHIGAHITAHDLAAELEVEAIVAEEVLQRLQADGRVSCLKPNPQGPPTRQVQRLPSGATSQDELTSAHEWTEADDGPSDAETVAHWNSSPPPRDRRAASGEASPRKKLRVPLKKQPIAHQKQPLGDQLQATRSSKRQRKASMSEPIAPARL